MIRTTNTVVFTPIAIQNEITAMSKPVKPFRFPDEFTFKHEKLTIETETKTIAQRKAIDKYAVCIDRSLQHFFKALVS